jgi:UDP:flavonoid glycosyltransferase YjiC (YdhE family)
MCLRAVERLREEFELRDASPFSYVTSLSPHLNIYCEPPEFLDAEDRSVFEPLAFFGCLPDRPGTSIESSRFDSYFKCDAAAPLRVYVSFGTVVWRYFGPEASAALRAIADACNGMEEVRTLISLGGHGLDAGFTESLAGKRVRVASFVDQPAVLQQADVFITHHGLNSTHESVFHRVPMVSYPFFSDQPALARKCQSLGLAVPLGESVRAPVCSADVQSALQTVRQRRFALARALDRAREWEVRVIESRGTTIARLEELMRANPAPQRSSRS